MREMTFTEESRQALRWCERDAVSQPARRVAFLHEAASGIEVLTPDDASVSHVAAVIGMSNR